MKTTLLVRYGVIPEVARFGFDSSLALQRGEAVVVETHRGRELGTVLEELPARAAAGGNGTPDVAEPETVVVRPAEPADHAAAAEHRAECETEFAEWRRRIDKWELSLELIDLEWTLDRKTQILYVLNNRGPDCTKLALQAAAAGLGLIYVQPVGADSLLAVESSGCGAGEGG